jgi:hypothetical protein
MVFAFLALRWFYVEILRPSLSDVRKMTNRARRSGAGVR